MAGPISTSQGTLLQPSVVKVIHDEVVALCRAYYNSVFLEIDGIICVTLLDSKEQQVIKIHETLTSVSGKANEEKQNSKPDNLPPNFQSDIATLDSLIKSATANCRDPQNECHRNKRKRKPPKQKHNLNNIEETSSGIYSQIPEKRGKMYDNNDASQDRKPNEVASSIDSCPQEDSVNPENIVIKMEPHDPEYDSLNDHCNQNSMISNEKIAGEHVPSYESNPDCYLEDHPVKVEVFSENLDQIENVGLTKDCEFESSDLQQFNSFSRNQKKKNIDGHGKAWIEQVKNNVTRYQEALKRAGKIEVAVNMNKFTSDEHRLTRGESCQAAEKQPQSKLPNLINILNTPPLSNLRLKALVPSDTHNGPNVKEGSSIPANDSRSDSESPLPHIKIEVDDVRASYSDDYDNKQMTNTFPTSTSNSVLQNHNQSQTAGKLENRYPALFSHLQTGSQASLSKIVSESDSLVNRLPFISFQEIFSNSTKSSSPKTGEQPENAKRQWNWTKRKVRKSKDNLENNGIQIHEHNSKKNLKNKSDSDNEWKPNAASDCSVESDEKETVQDHKADRPKRRKRPKINFAEIGNSDVEFDDYDEDWSPQSTLQLRTSAEETGNTSDRTGSVQLMQALVSSAGPSGSAVGITKSDLHCSICGLDFNQEYRRNYHMIKVHGVLHESKTNLFR